MNEWLAIGDAEESSSDDEPGTEGEERWCAERVCQTEHPHSEYEEKRKHGSAAKPHGLVGRSIDSERWRPFWVFRFAVISQSASSLSPLSAQHSRSAARGARPCPRPR